MTKVILRYCLFGLGVSAIGIGSSMLVFGSNVTSSFFVDLINWLFASNQQADDLSSANVDSELRFYSIFWIAYGVVLMRATGDVASYTKLVPILIAMFFAGGLARLMSLLTVGSPHLLFLTLMGVELVFPVFLIGLWALNRPSRLGS